MGGNNVQRNFVGDVRGCSRCACQIAVTAMMVRRHKYVCGECESRAAVAWAQRNRDKKRASNNQYAHAHAAARSARTAKWRAQHPDKRAAHQAVQTAIRNGLLAKAPCEACGATARIHAHHDDYAKPLDVRWLCHTHHMKRHGRLAQEQAA